MSADTTNPPGEGGGRAPGWFSMPAGARLSAGSLMSVGAWGTGATLRGAVG
jgi:hypothetical protein